MEELRSLIQQVDDDYLIGLTNKGILKRAYKDLEGEQPKAEWKDAEVVVSLKEEACIIRIPLGESSCSCPSRSICRHVVTGILWLKKTLDTIGQTIEAVDASVPKALEEILQMPVERLKRACGSGRFRQFINRVKVDGLPPLEESSIVTVMLPWENVTVKLLEPFAYSTCSCHSQELCAHKAQAALIYLLYKEKITLKDLEAMQEEERFWDLEQVRQACKRIQEVIVHQINTGLSRYSSEASKELERLAVTAHRAALPQLENWLREVSGMYIQYASRSAAFRSEDLLRNLLKLYIRAGEILETDSQEQIRTLAGTFRDTYEQIGDLELVGMGTREFHSKSGYEGEIYYFLETRHGNWYTWTDARPVYYERTRSRPLSVVENIAAPWGLPCSREEMLSLSFVLKNAKAASGGRLSVSQETRGEIAGPRDLTSDAFQKKIIWDYEVLAEQYFQYRRRKDRESRSEYLAMIGAVHFGETAFDKIRQRFSWNLFDEKGRTLPVSLCYTKEEKTVICLLERLEQRLRKQELQQIVFFGFVYLDETGRMCLYPVEFFQIQKIRPMRKEEECIQQKRLPGAELLRAMEQYCSEAVDALTDLFVCGLYSVQDTTVKYMNEIATDGERLGFHRAGSGLNEISQRLTMRRHQMESESAPVVEEMAKLCRYFMMCKEKLSYDNVFLTMREERQDESE